MNSRRFTSNFSRASKRKIALRETYRIAGFRSSLCPLWVISGQQTSCRGVEDVRFTRKSGYRSGYFRRQALGERRHRGLARRHSPAPATFSSFLKRELKQDSPPNNHGSRDQNALVKAQNFAATNCGVAVGGVQCAPNLNDVLLKFTGNNPARETNKKNKYHGKKFTTRSDAQIAAGRKNPPKKNPPRRCDSPLLLLIEPQFFMLRCAVYFVFIA